MCICHKNETVVLISG